LQSTKWEKHKAVLTGITERTATSFTKSGKTKEIGDRVIKIDKGEIVSIRDGKGAENWKRGRGKRHVQLMREVLSEPNRFYEEGKRSVKE